MELCKDTREVLIISSLLAIRLCNNMIKGEKEELSFYKWCYHIHIRKTEIRNQFFPVSAFLEYFIFIQYINY